MVQLSTSSITRRHVQTDHGHRLEYAVEAVVLVCHNLRTQKLTDGIIMSA